jgi:hypothetical protein
MHIAWTAEEQKMPPSRLEILLRSGIAGHRKAAVIYGKHILAERIALRGFVIAKTNDRTGVLRRILFGLCANAFWL